MGPGFEICCHPRKCDDKHHAHLLLKANTVHGPTHLRPVDRETVEHHAYRRRFDSNGAVPPAATTTTSITITARTIIDNNDDDDNNTRVISEF